VRICTRARRRTPSSYFLDDHDVVYARNERPRPGGTVAVARPETKVLYVSGYADDAAFREATFSRAQTFS